MLSLRIGPAVLAAVLGALMLGGPALAQEGDAATPAERRSRQAAAAGEEQVRAWDAAKESVLLGLEELRAEIQMLKALSVLQDRLLDWNRVLAESGSGPSSLEESLCEAAALQVWCGLLPATFGREEGDG